MCFVTADGVAVTVGMSVSIRIGTETPRFQWRCRDMVVEKIKRTGRLKLRPKRGRTPCERMSGEVFASPRKARGL